MTIRPTVAQVDLEAIRHNCRTLRALLRAGVIHTAVVKANAYGHGDVPVARACLGAGVDRLAVALVEEGVRLRAGAIDAPVLVLSQSPESAAPAIVEHGLTPTVWTFDAARAVDEAARRRGVRHDVHVAVDTGMRREGVELEDAADVIARMSSLEHVRVEGIWTHFANADDPFHPANTDQLERFRALLDTLETQGTRPPVAHAANSAATMLLPASHFDMVRTGVAVYGLNPAPSVPSEAGLRPAMRVASRVTAVRRVRGGDGIAYGHTYAPDRDATVAVVPIGYADGYPRSLSNLGEVLIGGTRRRIAGRVSMDQIVLDCGDDRVDVGDEVVVIGRQGSEEITADEIAAKLGTINYEIVTSISARVPRTYDRELA